MNIKLIKFNQKFLSSIEGNKEIFINSSGKYHLISINNVKVGVVGYIPVKDLKTAGFVQIILVPKFRGKGILKLAEDLLAKKYKLKTFWATIKKDNVYSIDSHLRAGYKLMAKKKLENLRELGYLKNNEVRLEKSY